MRNFKTFFPKVDVSRRLVMTRIYTGINDSNSFCYQITKIKKNGTIDKRFKTLYSFGTDDFASVKKFLNSRTGEPVKVFKKPFKSVFGLKDKYSAEKIWNFSEKNL